MNHSFVVSFLFFSLQPYLSGRLYCLSFSLPFTTWSFVCPSTWLSGCVCVSMYVRPSIYLSICLPALGSSPATVFLLVANFTHTEYSILLNSVPGRLLCKVRPGRIYRLCSFQSKLVNVFCSAYTLCLSVCLLCPISQSPLYALLHRFSDPLCSLTIVFLRPSFHIRTYATNSHHRLSFQPNVPLTLPFPSLPARIIFHYIQHNCSRAFLPIFLFSCPRLSPYIPH